MQSLDFNSVRIEKVGLTAFDNAGISADVLRLDHIHPVVSGNKWFKLKYYFEEAIKGKASAILTFGGSWSNHIVATAWACKDMGLPSIGIIRGEEPIRYSHTLSTAAGLGMQLIFVSRNEYDELNAGSMAVEFLQQHAIPADTYKIPAGGEGWLGVKGAAEITAQADTGAYSHIACSIGTSTMFAGLVTGGDPSQTIIGFPALKGFQKIPEEYAALIRSKEHHAAMYIEDRFHFGGYARKTGELIAFMNKLYDETRIKTDFVYTGKLFYGCVSLATEQFFPDNSRLLIIHSGGLQGNASLPPGVLNF